MLDVAGVGVCVLFFIGCELYIRYCDRLLRQSRAKGRGIRS